MTREEYNQNPNLCIFCGKEIICDNKHKPSYISKRRYCSIDCYYKSKNVYNGSGIYCIKNKINNKIYVGQSVHIERRLREHKSMLRNNHHDNTHLQKSWVKYGEENFEFQILEKCDVQELDEKEIYWIDFYKSNDGKYGYNYESGGHENKNLSDETKLKISNNHHNVSGNKNPFYGKTHTQESIQKFMNHPNYINRKYLGEDSHFAKLTLEQATFIKKFLKENNITFAEEKELASQFNVGINAIQKIKHNRTWKQIAV
jgi:group I intron endonuclease